MAKIIVDDKEAEIEDNKPIKQSCEQLGVTIGCSEGFCGTCRVNILEGGENLAPLNEAEVIMNCTGSERLACQARIKQGTVKIKFW